LSAQKFKVLKKIALITFALLLGNTGFSQDAIFSQFYANPLYLNPALTGVERCPRFIMNYRNQWPAIPGQFVTYSASYDQHVDAVNGGLGLLVMNDRLGDGTLRNVNASALYSYELPVNRKLTIRAGFQATFFQKYVDWDKLTFGDMIDPRYGFIYDTQEAPQRDAVMGADFSTGFLMYTKNFYGGFSIHHLTEPEERFLVASESRLPRKFTAHAGYVIPLNKRYPKEGSVSPSFMYQVQGAPASTYATTQQIFYGLYANKGPITGGFWYRNNDAFVILIGLTTDHFRVGYSYDLTVSKLTNKSAGSHEISMAMVLDCKPKRRKFRPLNCPKF
jgi:type IX secretion system PorP/SprF family membrane protein